MVNPETMIWPLSTLLAAGIVLAYFAAFRRRRRSDRIRKEEAVRLGIDRPVAQFPFIESSRCIGCGSCVDACPEGDVLGVVGGTATVINGFKCVGHGNCEEVCPVGALKVGLGDLRSREDIPLLDRWLETNVAGLFIAGELGGLALLRNAVDQGRRVVERICQRTPTLGARAAGGCFDLVIVGGGPAGAAAAATAHERGLSHVVLEQEKDLGGSILHYPRQKLVLVRELVLPLSGVLKGGEYSKERILEVFEGMRKRLRLNVRFGERVLGVRKEGHLFAVHSQRGAYLARSVVLALGRRGTPRKLGVPGEERPNVMYKLLDATRYVNRRILVVGGGDSAAEAALGLARQPGNTVILACRSEKLVRINRKNEQRINELISNGRLKALFRSEVLEILQGRVRLRSGSTHLEIANDYVFVFAGGEPPFGFLRQLGIRFGGETRSRSAAAGA